MNAIKTMNLIAETGKIHKTNNPVTNRVGSNCVRLATDVFEQLGNVSLHGCHVLCRLHFVAEKRCK